jgi:hypothetical protein
MAWKHAASPAKVIHDMRKSSLHVKDHHFSRKRCPGYRSSLLLCQSEWKDTLFAKHMEQIQRVNAHVTGTRNKNIHRKYVVALLAINTDSTTNPFEGDAAVSEDISLLILVSARLAYLSPAPTQRCEQITGVIFRQVYSSISTA